MTQTMDQVVPQGWTITLPTDFWEWLAQTQGEDAVTAAHTDAKSLAHAFIFYGTSKEFQDWFATSRFNNARFAERMASDPQKAQSYIFGLKSQYEQTKTPGDKTFVGASWKPAGPEPGPDPHQLNAFQTIKSELEDWGLGGLADWAWGLFVQGFDEPYILSQLHTTDIFKEKFPEYAARVEAGHRAMSPAEILAARDDLRAVTKDIYGTDLSADEVAKLIINNRSASEWQHDLGVFKSVQNLGGDVQALFQQEYGHTLSEQDLHNFFDPTKNTAEIDKAYENAVFRGYLRNLGVQNGVVTEDQVAQLRARGFDIPTVMESYRKIAQSLPSIERLAAIDNGISGDKANPFDSLGEAFSNFALLDPNAQSDILRLFANETARFAPSGGIAGGGVGFLSRFERK